MTRTHAVLRNLARRTQQLRACAGPQCRWPSPWGYALKQDDGSGRVTYADPAGTFLGVDEGAASATFVITTTSQDRDGDVVASRGVVLDNYRRNPLWLLGHDAGGALVIGRAIDPQGRLAVRVEDSRILCTCFFDQGDPDAMYVFGKVARGFLRATSIGFLPLEADRIEKQDTGPTAMPFGGWFFKRWELLESSIVKVPSNPWAVLLHDLDQAKISVKLKKALAPLVPPRPVWSNGVALKAEPYDLTPAQKWELQQLLINTAIEKYSSWFPFLAPDKAAGLAESAAAEGGSVVAAETFAGTDIQRLILPKDKFPARAEAAKWVEANGYEADQPLETDTNWVYVQFPDAECRDESSRNADLADGVRAVVCQRQVEPDGGSEVETMSADKGCQCADPKAKMPKDAVKNLADNVVWQKLTAGMAEEAKSALDDCVSAKIPKLIDEGYPEDQAVAVAFSMCGEKMNTTPQTKQDDLPPPDDMADVSAEDMPEETSDESQQWPLGAQCLIELADHIQAKLPQLEPGIAVRKLYEKILPMLVKAAEQDYPGLDLGVDLPAEEETPPADETPADTMAAEDGGDEYKNYDDDGADEPVQVDDDDAALAPVHKRMTAAHKEIVRDAAEHLEETGRHPDMPKAFKGGHKYHAAALSKMLMESGRPGEEPGDDDDEMSKWAPVLERMDAWEDRFRTATGQLD